MSEITLEVNGIRYGGWEGMTVSRSIETVADAFSLQVSDHGSEWPIAEEDECTVRIDGEVVLSGWVERPIPSFTETSSLLSVSGYAKPGVLTMCSAVLDKWTFRKSTVEDIARKVCEPFGVTVTVQEGLQLDRVPGKLVVNPGDSPFDVIYSAALATGVLVVSEPTGGILLTRSGSDRAHDALVQGVNIKAGSGDYDASGRFHRYIVMTQSAGTDNAHGNATRIRAEAYDDGVRRTNRVLIIRPEAGHSNKFARQRGDWEARNRAAGSKSAEVTVHGWKQSNGQLWKPNLLVNVDSSKLRIDEELLISHVDYSKDSGGEVATLRLVRPDAFEPDASARVKA